MKDELKTFQGKYFTTSNKALNTDIKVYFGKRDTVAQFDLFSTSFLGTV